MKFNPDEFGEPIYDPALFTLPEPVYQPDLNSSDPFVPLPAPYRGGAAQMFDEPQQPRLPDEQPTTLDRSRLALPQLQPLYRPNERTFDPSEPRAIRPDPDMTNFFGDEDPMYRKALENYQSEIDRRGVTQLSETPSPGQILGRTATMAGRLGRAVVGDIAAGYAGDPSQSGNIPAAWSGEELPIDKTLGTLDSLKMAPSTWTPEGWMKALGAVALNAGDMAGKLAVAGGVGKLVNAGRLDDALLPGKQLFGAAFRPFSHLPTAATFSSDAEKGIDPMQTLIFAGIGPVADAGAKVTRDVLKTAMGEYQPILTPVLKAMADGSDKFAGYVVNDTAQSIPFLSKPLVQKTIEQLGRFGATNLYLDAVAAAEASGLPDEQRSQAIMDAFVQNIALSAMGLSDILKDHPAIERSLRPEQKANIERVTNLVRDSWAMSDPAERLVAEGEAPAAKQGPPQHPEDPAFYAKSGVAEPEQAAANAVVANDLVHNAIQSLRPEPNSLDRSGNSLVENRNSPPESANSPKPDIKVGDVPQVVSGEEQGVRGGPVAKPSDTQNAGIEKVRSTIRSAWESGVRDFPQWVRNHHPELFAELERENPAAPEPTDPKTRQQRAEEATARNLAAAGEATVIKLAPPHDQYGKGFNVIISQVVSQPGKWQAAMFKGDEPLAQDHGFYDSREDAIRSYSGQSVGGQKPKGEPDFVVVEAMTPKKKAPAPPVDQPVKSPEPVAASLATEAPAELIGEHRDMAAQGREDIRQLIHEANLHPHAEAVAHAILNEPALRDADISDLRVELKRHIDGGYAGTLEGSLLTLGRSGMQADTFPHEIFHLLERMLPPADREAVERWRVEEIRAKYGDSRPDLEAGMTSQEFLAAEQRGLVDREDYRLSNRSEWLAGTFGKRFADEHFNHRNDSAARTLLEKVKRFAKGLWDSVRRAGGADPTRDQLYRELLDGKFKQDPEADRHYDELQGSFASTAREASSHEALAVTPEQKETEGRSLQAQQADLAHLTTQHGAGALSGSAQSLLQYHDALGIAATGHRLTGTPMGYEQLRQNVTPVERNNLAGAAGQAWEVARQRRAELDKELAAEQQRQGGNAFLNKVARTNAAQIRAKQAAQAITISDTILTTALKKAVAALNYERLNALDRAMLEGQMKEMRQQAQARAGMQSLITDMTTALGTTPRGQHLLQHGGTEAEIATEYRRIKTAAGQPMTNDALIRTGAYVVGKSKTLRDQMLANSLLAQAPVRAQMTAYEAQILAAYQKDPVKAIRQMLKDRGKMTTVKEQAAFAWQQLHADLLKDHKRLADLQDAADVLGKALDSPEAQRIQKLIRQDRGELGNKEPIRVGATAKITMPSGREVPVELERLTNSSAEFRKNRAVWMTSQAELENWISQHTEGDPDYGYHVSSLNRLLSTYTDLDVLQPGDQSTIRPLAMTRVTQAVDAIGGRMARATKGLVAEWERVGNKAAWWTQDWTGKIKDSRLKALQSHGLDTTGNNLNASLRAYEDVRNELAASWNREAGGLKVGDTVGTKGWKVTAQDLAQLRTEQQAAAAGFKIAPDQVTEDTRGDARTFRKALAGTDYTTPRRLNYDRVPFAKAFLDAAKGHWQDVGPVVDKDFPAFIRSFLEFRDPGDGATATIFDGAGAAFEQVRRAPANNWNDFIQQVATVSGETPDNTAAIILKEMTSGIGKWRAVAEPGGVTVSGGDKTRNSFTQGRGDAMTFPYFYEHGFKDTSAIVSFGTGIHSKPMDAVANGFKVIEADLQRQLREYAAATKAELTAGRMAAVNGTNYDTWRDLDRRLSIAQGAIRGLTGENTEVAQMDKDIDRAMTGLVGKLIGTAATLRNVVSGPAQLGPQLFALNGSLARSFPLATIFTWMHSGSLRMLPQALGAGARLAYKLPGGLISAIGNIPVDRSAAKFYWRTVRPAIEDLGRLMYERQKSYKSMMDAGIHHIPDIVTEFDNRILGNLASGNRMDLGDVGPLRFVLQSALGASEATLDAATRGFSPLAGDTALNDATRTVMLSRFGEIHRIEERLKGLYLDWKRSGYRAFNLNSPNDEANLFTRQEMFPSLSLREGRVFGTEGDMNRMRGAFKRAGFQFDAEAVRFFKALETDPKAQFLSNDQRNQFASSMIDAVNRATKANEPLALQGGGVLKSVFRPFFPWPTRMFGELYQLFSIPASAGKGAASYRQMQMKRAAEWGLYGATVAVPALVGMALLKVGGEQIMRTYNQVAFNQTSFSRQPWEWGSTGQQLKGWALSAFDMVPLLNILTNKLFNDMPGRAQFDPSIVAVEKTKDLVKYIGGAIQTGDPSYRLPELIEGLVPDSKILINRLPGMEGKRELNNIANIYRRNADSEMLKPIGGVGGVNATELTPYGSRMANAAIKGDTTELKRLYDEAVAKATEMGKANPEQAVNSMLKSANPELRALKTTMTPEQYQDFLGRLDSTDRAYIEDGQQRFQDSLAALGLNTAYTKDAKEPSGSVAGVAQPKATPSSGSVRGGNYGVNGPGLLAGAPAPRVGVGRVSGAATRMAAPRVLRSPSLRSRTSRGSRRALGRSRTVRLRGGLLR